MNTLPSVTRGTGCEIDFSRWGVLSFKDDTGLGRMAIDVRRVFGFGRHIVVPSDRITGHPVEPPGEVALDPAAPESAVREALAGLQGVLFMERHSWHPALLRVARQMGVFTVCVPMWEWFRGWERDIWKDCNLFVCPTRFTVEIVQSYGWTNAVYLPWPLDLSQFAARHVPGPARLFIHNAGLVDPQDRKATRETIQAFKKVKRRDVRLIVRVQQEVDLPALNERIEVRFGNLNQPAELYTEGDVAIQPSKMEGLGFMVIEPIACGVPVITLDYPPMNEFVPYPTLRVAPRWFKRRAFPSAWVKHAHLRLPRLNDLARKIEWCAENDLSAISQANRAWAERTFEPGKLREEWRLALQQHLWSSNRSAL